MADFFEGLYSLAPGGVPLGRIAIAIVVVATAFGLAAVVKAILARLSGRLTGIPSALAAKVRRPSGFLIVLLCCYGAARILPVSEGVVTVLDKILLIGITGGVVWLLICSTDCVADKLAESARASESRLDDQMLPILRNIARALIFILGVVFVIQALGYPVGGIVAGLGIGGMAVALAAQDTLSGIFASMAIFLEKPFMVGDFVDLQGVQGTISDVGLRSTRILTIENTLVTVPNRKIVENTVDNWAHRNSRRTLMAFGLVYGTSLEALEGLLERLRDNLRSDPEVEPDTWSVHFRGFGESSLEVEVLMFLKTASYREWLAMRERKGFMIMREVEAAGLAFAFPTRTIRIER